MGKRTSSAKMLNKEAKGNGSSVDQQILATLKEIKKKLDDIEAAISDEMRDRWLRVLRQAMRAVALVEERLAADPTADASATTA